MVFKKRHCTSWFRSTFSSASETPPASFWFRFLFQWGCHGVLQRVCDCSCAGEGSSPQASQVWNFWSHLSFSIWALCFLFESFPVCICFLFSHLPILMCLLLIPLFLFTCTAVSLTWTHTLMHHILVSWHILPLSLLLIKLRKMNILIPQVYSLWHLTHLYHLLSYLCCHLYICTLSQVTSPDPSYTCELSPGCICCAISHLCTILSYECCLLNPV